MPKMQTWVVALAGKWGGTRTVTVVASTEQVARKRATERAFINEHIVSVHISRTERSN